MRVKLPPRHRSGPKKGQFRKRKRRKNAVAKRRKPRRKPARRKPTRRKPAVKRARRRNPTRRKRAMTPRRRRRNPPRRRYAARRRTRRRNPRYPIPGIPITMGEGALFVGSALLIEYIARNIADAGWRRGYKGVVLRVGIGAGAGLLVGAAFGRRWGYAVGFAGGILALAKLATMASNEMPKILDAPFLKSNAAIAPMPGDVRVMPMRTGTGEVKYMPVVAAKTNLGEVKYFPAVKTRNQLGEIKYVPAANVPQQLRGLGAKRPYTSGMGPYNTPRLEGSRARVPGFSAANMPAQLGSVRLTAGDLPPQMY